MAALKVEEARAQFNVTDADRYPQLNASSGITYSGGLKGDKPTTQEYDAGLELSYELDFFGKLKNMSEADRQNLPAKKPVGPYTSCWSPAFHRAISASNWRTNNSVLRGKR